MSTPTTPGQDVFRHDVRQRNLRSTVAALETAIAKVGKRLPDVVFTVETGAPWASRWCLSHRTWGCNERNNPLNNVPCYEVPDTAVTVTVHAGNLPLWDDVWRVAGILTTDAAGVTTAKDVARYVDYVAVEGTDGIAGRNRHLAGQCVHCNTTRKRTTTVLLTDGTEIRPVGRNCLADYTGNSIRAEVLPLLIALGERFAQSAGVDTFDPTLAPVLDVVALAVAYIDRDGRYVPAGEDTLTTPSTATQVRAACRYTDHGQVPAITADKLTEAHRATAAAAITAILATTDEDTFTANLRAAAGADWVSVTGKGNPVGLLAFLPEWHRRDAQWQAKRAAEKAQREAAAAARVNAHVGAIRERREFTGTVVTLRAVETDFGMSTLMVVDTAEGTVKVFGTVSGDITEGQEVTFTGTVVEHGEYQGHRQTRVNRIKIAV